MTTTEDRYQAILQLVAARGRVSITELTRQLKVSEMTIRRDLAALDAEGAVTVMPIIGRYAMRAAAP